MDIYRQSMCLLFNTLSRLPIAFIPRSKYLLISWLQSPSAVILESPKIKSVIHCFICFPFHLPWSDGTIYHDLRFFGWWVLSKLFHSTFYEEAYHQEALLFFAFCHKSESFTILSSVYLRLLIYLPAIWLQLVLHPAQHFPLCILHIS